ncbi:membrane-spanning 4-domains subfamily A member 18 isoform X2 [Meriones unguiculatus]|uniref:membrane-spanning 4-domains subfamily A member 18 isoform X2 n=1 Tax=Meriones unguiculatus TaxID=10047 RepID=UPI00293EE582|nr:membrane-spanning 4-domains subfamily A member 18 isoform X2 [Meriones unguiculatus]
MSKQEHVSVTVPGNVHVTQPSYATVSGSQEKPLEKTTYPTSATVLPYNPGSANLQSPHIVIQNPAGMTDLQAQPAGLQYPAEMAGVQTPPGGTQYSPEITSVQILPGDPQNPLNTVPGQTQTSSHPQWNLSFVTFPEFNPKKFINEEVRTLGAIQILIGLFHIFSAVNPQLYKAPTVLGASAYLIWGGLSFIISGSLSVCAEKSASSCMEEVRIATKAISGGLLPFVLLEFILTCVVSHFGCQAVCWTHFENMTAISSMFGGNTVNTTAGPVITTSPDNATNIPVQPTLPSHVPPEHTYQTVTPQK